MKCKIRGANKVNSAYEFTVGWDGYSYHVVYGQCANEWFVAITNWKICTSMREPTDLAYNTKQISDTHLYGIKSAYLAQAIKEHWEELKKW